jgi:Zn finger protein HypA/HybF involved in hydrogenase expression
MGSLERKLSRKKGNKGKKDAEKEMATKVALFGKLADKCLTCEKPFDKMDKEQVMSWNVIVRQEEEKVNLYCPECWEKALKIIGDFKKHLENKKEE